MTQDPSLQTQQSDSDITLYHLARVDNQTLVRLSELSIPEIEGIKEEIATIFPAGNLPAMILSGLTTLKDRRITRKRAAEDINTLFQGASLMPQGLYSVLFAGPAVVLASYQKILQLAGKDFDTAFPEGPWQYYLQFGLREDTARHTNETRAYHRERPQRGTLVDDISAWLMTAIHTLFDTDGLTSALWTEWTTMRVICDAMVDAELVERSPFSSMLLNWHRARPYRTPAGVSYAEERRAAFESFAQHYYEQLPDDYLLTLGQRVHEMAQDERQPYQRQMSLLAYLEPTRYRDERIPVPLWDAKVGLIWRGRYYLFDAIARDQNGHALAFTDNGESWPLSFDADGNPLDRDGRALMSQGGWLYRVGRHSRPEPVAYLSPASPGVIKGQVHRVVQTPRPPSASTVDLQLVESPRAEQERIRALLPTSTQEALQQLRNAPVIVNWDQQDGHLPLGRLRQKAQRGVGDHPLTIMRTRNTMVFDQSHIFFDGLWGMAIAEVMTNQAIAWSHKLANTPIEPREGPEPLDMGSSPEVEVRTAALAEEFHELMTEAQAETELHDLDLVNTARTYLRMRGISLTINDLLILARVIHAAHYRPSRIVAERVAKLPAELQRAVVESLEHTRTTNPALLIPMDASLVTPRERIFPVTFRNPLTGLIDAYDDAASILVSFRANPGNEQIITDFDKRRGELFSYLQAFGGTLATIKKIGMGGESLNIATLKLMAHLPASVQRALNEIPERVDILNEIIKGEEVFSNVGRVAPESSLLRFMSAKDDGRAKRLVWGIMTDDHGVMHITLRDFRSHVAPLAQAGEEELMHMLAGDYVQSYAQVLIRLAGHLSEMASAETESTWK